MKTPFVIAIVGAESTGKTTLARELHEALVSEGHRVALVTEALREFCDTTGRTPIAAEQAGLAAEQTRRIADALSHDVVIADTTALMIAVYSELVFADRSLYAGAQEAHRRCDLTLLTAIDLPWQADGHQRDGAHVQVPVDALLRNALQRAEIPYSVVAGTGAQRTASALKAVRHALDPSAQEDESNAAAWHWVCERCGDVDCERHLLPRLSGR
jgi:nicotinamide riboside kinase